jgi:hypothetical protein
MAADQNAKAAVNRLLHCALSGGAFLTASELTPGPFVQFLSQDLTVAPVKGGISQEGPGAVARRTFTKGHIDGDLSELAVSGPDRAAEDNYARSLGYSIGPWPLVPLNGPVVSHNPGVLEVYQEDLVFDSTAGAQAMESIFRTSVTLATGARLIEWRPSSVTADDSFAVETIPSLGVPKQENTVRMVGRMGSLVVSIIVQGGDAVNVATASPIGDVGVQHLASSCHL